MREKVVFQTNAPVTVALAYADGLPVQGRFGEQIMYTLTDDESSTCRQSCGINWLISESSPVRYSQSARLNASRATAMRSNGGWRGAGRPTTDRLGRLRVQMAKRMGIP